MEDLNRIIDDIRQYKRKKKIISANIPKLVFICGEQILKDDGTIKDEHELIEGENKRYFLTKKLSKENNLVPVISEHIYKISNGIDMLTFEELLAELSDSIIVIVESDGTKCELGAFTLNDRLCEKLIIINDEKYSNMNSFINHGPIKKLKEIDEMSVILENYNYIEFCNSNRLEQSIKLINNSKVHIQPIFDEIEFDMKTMVYSVLNIIQLLQPIKESDVEFYFKYIFQIQRYKIINENKHNFKNISRILKLIEAIELVKMKTHNGIKKYEMNSKYSFHNIVFDLTKNEFLKYRIKIIKQYQKVGDL